MVNKKTLEVKNLFVVEIIGSYWDDDNTETEVKYCHGFVANDSKHAMCMAYDYFIEMMVLLESDYYELHGINMKDSGTVVIIETD